MGKRSARSRPWLLAAALFGTACVSRAQSVDDLAAHYSGRVDWRPDAGALTFLTSGRVDFNRSEYRGGIWTVPPEVKRVVIEDGVRVEGQFSARNSLDISGRGVGRSTIYGTPAPALLHDLGLDHDGGIMPYSTVFASGRGVLVRISGLTSLDPLAFHFTGAEGAVLDVEHVAAIDDRGGFYNHSDGVQGGWGTKVNDAYFETGDDVIKIYGDMTVTDTTIKMIRNAVPIQFGWGSYGDGAHATLRNIRIFGDSGRNRDFPVIEAQAGVYRKTVDIDGLEVDNPRATLFRFNDPAAVLDITIRNARISVGGYGESTAAGGQRTVCATLSQLARYDCR